MREKSRVEKAVKRTNAAGATAERTADRRAYVTRPNNQVTGLL